MSILREWEAVRADLSPRSRIVYWNFKVTEMLRVAVRRMDDGYRWTVYVRPEPRYAWTRQEVGVEPTLGRAKAAGITALTSTKDS